MWGNRLACLVTALALWGWSTPVGAAASQIVEVRFEGSVGQMTVLRDLERLSTQYVLDPNPAGAPSLPWKMAVTTDNVGSSGEPGLVVLAAETLAVDGYIPPAQPDQISSDTSQPRPEVASDDSIYVRDVWYPNGGVLAFPPGEIMGRNAAAFLWCPFRYNALRGQLIVVRRGLIQWVGDGATSPPLEPADTVAAADDIKDIILPLPGLDVPNGPLQTPGPEGSPSWVCSGDVPLGVSYVIVTKESYIESVRPLAQWKARRGIAAGIATIERITEQYPAVDPAAAIREYLKAAYAAGLKWVTLAGDENIVPIRYAYAGYESSASDLHQFQICDLYYGELDGDWDANGNGIWGEYFGDKAQIYAELFIGRLPFANTSEAETMIEKIIAYERGPDDAAYLGRELSVSADQMRDWSNGIGQQRLVANAMPAWLTHDLSSMVESPSGIDSSPLSPDGPAFDTRLASGYGWVNYYVHGRTDGFIVRSSGYLNQPRNYVFTFGANGDGSGHINDILASPYPGIHLSIACDQGAFDLDSPPFAPGVQRSVAEGLLLIPQGGAVAFVGQSRWGWVSSSYKLVQKFYEYVNDSTVPNHIGVYQSLAKLAFPSLRDMNYGNDLFGDPEMPTWRQAPREWTIAAPTTYGSGEFPWTIEAHDDAGGALPGALTTVSIGDSIWTLGMTNGSGAITGTLLLPTVPEAILTVSKPGYKVFVDTIPHEIIADVWDGGNQTPNRFQLLPNAPNPFNPSTLLSFVLPRTEHVTLVVYDILGRPVQTVVNGPLEAGAHQVEFDSAGRSGTTLSSGVYFAQLRAGKNVQVRKMALVK